MAPSVTYNEQELVLLLKQQSQEAFNYLYKNYAGVLYSIIKKVIQDDQTAQDVLQEVFVKIWNNIGQFNSDKGRIYTWMLNIARNASIDKLRSKGEVMKSKIQSAEDAVYSIQNALKTEQKTDTIGLKDAVHGLKPEYQVIVELSYFKGFTLEEVAKTLEIPLGTVKTRMRHAIQLLRQHYSN